MVGETEAKNTRRRDRKSASRKRRGFPGKERKDVKNAEIY